MTQALDVDEVPDHDSSEEPETGNPYNMDWRPGQRLHNYTS